MSNRIRLLAPSDVPQALELSRATLWDQTAADWNLVIEMNPAGCFAMESDGVLAATTTSIRYGVDLAWIGMVVTHPEFRGRGFARALMQHALDRLDVKTVKLDATEMGRPLYQKLGFVDECPIERWVRSPRPTPSIAVDEFTPNPALDREAFGADRGALLATLAKIEAASFGDAFAMGRGKRFGPCVSRSKEAALALAAWRNADQPMVWDLFPENNLAQRLGFEFSRRVTRMVRGRELRSNHSLVYACAGFEFG
jgi:GNAT superfamily N-acetyltransferase